jgi:antitoxin HicB
MRLGCWRSVLWPTKLIVCERKSVLDVSCQVPSFVVKGSLMTAKSHEFEVVLQPEEEGGFSVSVPALPGCHTQGETHDEALAMAKDAIEGYLEVLEERVVPCLSQRCHRRRVSSRRHLSGDSLII